MQTFSRLGILTIITLSFFTLNSNAQKMKDYLRTPGPIGYNKTIYNLSWTSHPAENYYKQEYLPAGERSESFHNMIMLETVVGDISIRDAVKGKINELEQRKSTDPMANYSVVENFAKGEVLLDFLISQSGPGQSSIVEWNVYRYTTLKDKSGRKGIVLFAYSKRGYGDGATPFLAALKTARMRELHTFAAHDVPVVTISH